MKINDNKSMIIPIFIMHSGCPQRCIFCNQKIASGYFPAKLKKNIFDAEVNSYLNFNKDKTKKVEIAFYGGNFTGLQPSYQNKLLSWANAYISAGIVHSVRISTRPDYITEEILTMLKNNGVTTVEIGAQSFIDKVLQFAQRGHDSTAIVKAMRLLKDYSFETSLHLMAGLPKDTKEGFLYSVEKTIELKPDMARIHPVLVLNNTVLADEYRQGKYIPLELSEAIELCSLALDKLSAAGIRIIRFGLHLSDEMKKNGVVLAGPIHPSLGSLVRSSIYFRHALKLLDEIPKGTRKICFNLSPHDVSNFRGFNNRNVAAIKNLYPQTKIVIESFANQERGVISLADDTGILIRLNVSLMV
jgi:histone acetyltransferase (RNA polymerase elongator complex component)